jgi:hypothetical protein
MSISYIKNYSRNRHTRKGGESKTMSLAKLSNSAKAVAGLGIVVGITLIILGTFTTTSGVTTAANTAINNFITGLGQFGTYAGIIVLAIIGSYLFNSLDIGKGSGNM